MPHTHDGCAEGESTPPASKPAGLEHGACVAGWVRVSRSLLAGLLAGASAMAVSESWTATVLALPLGALVELRGLRGGVHPGRRIALEVLSGAAAAGCVVIGRWSSR